MAKKLKVNSEEAVIQPPECPVDRKTISEFSIKFGREDMDKLVDKLNEVIRRLNVN